VSDIDLLAQKIDTLVDVSNKTSDSVSELTRAVTTLLIQTQNFEKQRVEDHKRMDRQDMALIEYKKECKQEHANIYRLLGIVQSKVDKALPIVGIMSLVITTIAIAALSGE